MTITPTPLTGSPGQTISPQQFSAVTTIANSAGGYNQLLGLSVQSRKKIGILVQLSAAAALTSLQLTTAVSAGGTHEPMMTDTDFNTAAVQVPLVGSSQGSPPNIHTCPASGWFRLDIDLERLACEEIALWAKGDAAVVTCSGNIR
jgi:hypothetical protein